jgi:deoxycytidine triphosphate deaminase
VSVLTKSELAKQVNIRNADDPADSKARGWNASTYDSLVGEIITLDGKHDSDTYELPPRGIVWLVSKEDYCLPNNVTGITTLRTTWTKSGVMTLTSGIVDPGYSGPLSTAVINFSKVSFPIVKGERFFRTLFIKHDPVPEPGVTVLRDDYIKEVLESRAKADKTFLHFDSFAEDIEKRIFKLPKLAFWVTIVGLALGLATLILPGIAGWTVELRRNQAQVEVLGSRLKDLESSIQSLSATTSAADKNEQLVERLSELEDQLEKFGQSLDAGE